MDRADFSNWLKAQSRETCVKIATRAALRVFPIVTHIVLPTTHPVDRNFLQLVLLVARAILTSGVGGIMPTTEIIRAANAAAIATSNATNAATISATNAHQSTANAATNAAYAAANTDGKTDLVVQSDAKAVNEAMAIASFTHATFAAYICANHAQALADLAPNAEKNTYAADAVYADAKIDAAKLFKTPIWHEQGEPLWLVSAMDELDDLLESGPEWSFWREWYQGFLIGAPMDWDLQKEIALIPDADWEKGPEWIAEKIEEIRARFELKQRILELENASVTSFSSRLGIGGNNPPETLQQAALNSKVLIVIWEPLLGLKAEAASETPDKSTILNLIAALSKALKAGLVWCASKADLAVDTIIMWGIPAGGGYLVMNPDKLAAVIEAAKSLARLIP